MLVLASEASGQEAVRDFDYTVAANPWLSLSNPAVYGHLSQSSISKVELCGEKDNGGLVDIDGSADCWNAGAETESFVRISDRIAFHGGLSFNYFRGKDMGGPVLVNTSSSPLNFYEESLSTAGIKTRETYFLTGGMTYCFNEKWSAGVSLDYKCINQTKRRDPRFQNYCNTLDAKASFLFSPSETFSFGFTARYRRELELLSAGTFGTKESNYYVFIDQGGFMGSREVLDGDQGYISTNNTRPMDSHYAGGSILFVSGTRTKFFNEVGALYRMGTYGTKSSSSVLFCKFGGPQVTYDGILLAPRGNDIHKAEISLGWQMLGNDVNSYAWKSEAGKSSVVEYYGSKRQLSRNDLSATLSYTWLGACDGVVPKWEVGARLDGSGRIQTTTIFPYYRNQRIFNADLSATMRRNFSLGKNAFRLGVDADFFLGFGTKAEDGASGSSGTKPKYFDDYLNRSYEYQTAPRAGGALTFRYTRQVRDRFGIYVEVSDNFTSLLKAPTYLSGQFRNAALLSVGCNF